MSTNGMERSSVLTEDNLIVLDDQIYGIALYDPQITNFKKDMAYTKDEYFYIYRGIYDSEIPANNQPGIYFNPKTKSYILVEVQTDEEKKKYDLDSHVHTLDPQEIIDMINRKEAIIVTLPESSKLFLPAINENDDILKRLVKMALIDKGIDIDNYRARFVDKNALFNFKQVIKGDTRLSMLLFDRGTEALGLKYTIIVEEVDPNHPVGVPLSHKLVASSTDTYDI